MYNVMNGTLTIDPQAMHGYIDTFLNQMYVFSKFEINKLEFFGEAGNLETEIKYMVKEYLSSNHIPNKKLNFEGLEKKDYMAYVYASSM